MSEERKDLSLSDRKQLVDEIFSETGMKVSVDDPLVVSVLMQSHSLRRVGSEVIEAISAVMHEMPALAEEIEQRTKGLLSQVNRSGESYLKQINEAVNTEAEKAIADLRKEVRAVLYAEISGPLEQIRRTNKSGIWRTFLVSMAGAAVAFGIALAGVHHFDPRISRAFDIASNIDRAWAGLTPTERQHIRQLVNQVQ